jgi:hypothetical protein
MLIENENFNKDDWSIKSVGSESNVKETNINKELKEFPHNLTKTKNLLIDQSDYHPISFKNYIPLDPNFLIEKLEYYEKIIDIENNYEKKMKKSVKEFLNMEKNPLSIVPKKNNVDLKRNLAVKLEKLNKKTELAILEMIKVNIQKQKDEFESNNDNLNFKELDAQDNLGNKLLLATNMQINIQEDDLKNDYKDSDEEDEDDISSDYDKGINDI